MIVNQQTSLLELVKAGDQFRDRGLPGTSMTDQGQSLSRLHKQAEAGQDRFVVRITEVQMIEVDFALEGWHVPLIDLNDVRVGINQGEGAFRCGESCLDLCPECGEVEHREEKLVQAHDKEI